MAEQPYPSSRSTTPMSNTLSVIEVLYDHLSCHSLLYIYIYIYRYIYILSINYISRYRLSLPLRNPPPKRPLVSCYIVIICFPSVCLSVILLCFSFSGFKFVGE